jgi:hypothetical protein
MRRRDAFGFIAVFVLAFVSQVAAHPLGNFSISQYSALQIGAGEVRVRYIVEMAEIPTFQEMQEAGLVAQAEHPSAKLYAARKAEILRAGVIVEMQGRPVALHLESQEIIFPAGAGGLPTLKLGLVFKGHLAIDAGGSHTLGYRDGNFPGRAGWKEIIAVAAPGVKLIDSSVPEVDRSAGLNDYPTDLLNSPPQQTTAQISFSVAPAAVAAPVNDRTTADKIITAVALSPAPPVSATNLAVPANNDPATLNSALTDSLQLKPNSQSTRRSGDSGWAWRLARLGARAWQDSGRGLSGRFPRHDHACGTARHGRDGGPYRRGLSARRNYPLCVKLYRAGTALSLAQRALGRHDRGPWTDPVGAPLSGRRRPVCRYPQSF